MVTDATRILYVSGQVPEAPGGTVPADFDAQCRLAWRNVLTVLSRAGMTERNLVKVTVFLSDRQHREANARIRHEVSWRPQPRAHDRHHRHLRRGVAAGDRGGRRRLRALTVR